MLRRIAIGLVLACLALWSVHVYAQGGLWDTYTATGVKAYRQGNYPEAERQFKAAIKEAEGFGLLDLRLARSLSDLALLYSAQVKYAQTEALYKRALAIYDKVLGPVHSDVAASLNNLAGVYVRQDAIAMGPSLLSAVFRLSEEKLGSRSLAAFAALFFADYGLEVLVYVVAESERVRLLRPQVCLKCQTLPARQTRHTMPIRRVEYDQPIFNRLNTLKVRCFDVY